MNLEEVGKKICDILASSAYLDESNDIKDLMIKVLTLDKNDPLRMMAIDSLISRCHPKWLGDYYVNNINYKQWTDLITDFKNELNKEK
ncbi:hypothetical protein [Pantoea stewartii]|uniref:hypothetical protein n=1 Tax=Pantoea stewartii TaxID=66269 RepID=UPI001562DAB5|nr:hypothetical protein [Pantoea stewartii]MBC0853036.1 hypothetical protein [Pantoea stewartii]NRH23330.1 hypothetical protein [Pantoea stewartii]